LQVVVERILKCMWNEPTVWAEDKGKGKGDLVGPGTGTIAGANASPNPNLDAKEPKDG
jgi:hypothetical protein